MRNLKKCSDYDRDRLKIAINLVVPNNVFGNLISRNERMY